MKPPSTLVVVPSERHVARWGRKVPAVVTRAWLRQRLFDALVADRALATGVEARLALAEVAAAIAPGDPLLAPVAAAGGDAWERTLDALDAALGGLRAAGVRAESLAAVAREAGGSAARAKALSAAMRGVDEVLGAKGLADPRGVGVALAARIAAERPTRVASVVGHGTVVARFVVDWDGGDAAWWGAMDRALLAAGGEGARVHLPAFDLSIDPGRERDPLEVVGEDVAQALDAAPVTSAIEAPLGDLRLVGPVPSGARVSLRAAAEADGQARAVLDAVRGALLGGAEIEGIAIAAARFDEGAIAALRRAFDQAGIPLHDARGEAPIAAGAVAFAFGVLGVAERGLPRREVAALVRSRYVDPARLGTDGEAMAALARALERTASCAAAHPGAALAATALGEGGTKGESRAALAGRLADALLLAREPNTRTAHVARARALFAALGIDPLRLPDLARAALRADEPPADLARAELRAAARDAHAWELLGAAMADYEAAARRLGLDVTPIPPSTFRHELARSLDARAGRPTAARAGAVRIAQLAELAGEPLSLLVLIDASEGSLPSAGAADPLVPEALAAGLRAIDPVRAPAHAVVRTSRELAALALAASRARSVVLTRRTRDEVGAAVAPAPLVAWLERGGVPSVTWRASPLDGPVVDAREALLRAAARAEAPSRRARVERTREARFERADPRPEPLLGDLGVAPLAAIVLRALAEETGAADAPLAVTALEGFATCPFRGYAERVLRAARVRPLREVPDPRESGTLKHRALAAAFDATAPMWRERPRDAARIRERAMAAADRVVRADQSASPLRRLALASVRETVAAVVAFSLADEAWDFDRAEQRFGDGGRASWPAVVLDDGEQRLALRGSIDRVDRGHGVAAVRAIDYKGSRSGAEKGMRGMGEVTFQVPLYARAAADATGARERVGLYLPATPRPDDVGPRIKKDFEAKWASLHAPRGAVTGVEACALDVIRAVRLGGVAPRPYDESACTRCEVSGGCRKPRFAIRAEDEENAAG